ncbi:MAG: 1-acyl-sn-glycerol-3-phosphate acyltransferase [Thermoanaerobaculia bacterium]|nr:1-acyl-sn-glycerol-3-phosphate acyltransferase [Thermoanaerobaculia bacterium]
MHSPASVAPRLPIWWTTITGNSYIILGSLVFSVLALLTAWIPPRGSSVQYWARCWARGFLWVTGVRVTCHADPAIQGSTSFVYMANHQSLFDIPVLLATLPVPALFMAKRELFRIPLFGWSMRAGGFISVDRSDPRSARESFREAVRRLQEGASVLLFPEETRSVDGNLLPFKRGGFLLARKGGAQIVPVGIDGTLGVQERSSYAIRASDVVVSYGTPRPPTDPDPAVDVPQSVRRAVSRLAGVGLGEDSSLEATQGEEPEATRDGGGHQS